MINFDSMLGISIPEGRVVQIQHNGNVLWRRKFGYVSLGDSIAVGHRINDDWETDYGWDAQYGMDGRKQTTLVPGCYTDLIQKELKNSYGENGVWCRSFAHSGDTVADLMEKLSHDIVRNTIAESNIVTICIGANDVLHYALTGLSDYLLSGDISTIDAQVAASLAVLDDDSASTSYMALFNELKSINEKATYVFTTVYNPYKYLWIDGSKDGFFKPMLDTIPQMTILGLEVDDLIKDGLLSVAALRNLISNINAMSAKAEDYVTRLGAILRKKITAFQAANPNFLLADTKAVFDPVPDRPISAPKHYNDLVNVEFTQGYDTAKMDWGALWEGSDAGTFWWNLATKHVSLEKLFDIVGFAEELVPLIASKVVEPNVDPHPEEYGHHALFCSFSDAFGWSTLPRRSITFNANGGTGTMLQQTVVAMDGYTAYANIKALGFAPGAEGYYFNGWNTKADGSGTSYTNGQFIGLTGDLELYAQWSNIYTVIFRHSMDSAGTHGSGDTGPMECYALWIDGAEQADLGAFSNSARTYRLPYGTPLGVIVAVSSGGARSYITLNGTTVSGKSSSCTYDFVLRGNTDIHFEWNWFLSDVTDLFAPQSYWNCYITTS